MPKKSNLSVNPANLRHRAEARLRDQREGQASPAGNDKPEADPERRLHELEVHEIELEMQNEELEEGREKLETLLEKYTDLYDFAPVGYLTLDPKGTINETNLTGASLLRVPRSALVNRNFGLFVLPADRAVFLAFLKRAFESGVREECEVRLLLEGEHAVDTRMRAIIFRSGQACRLAVTDITERKRAEADRLILNKLESAGILAAGIAHDFNNLLTVLRLNLELALALAPPGEKLAGYLKKARQTCSLAGGLTAQLVTFAEGGEPIRTTMFLSEVIQEFIRPVLSGSNVRGEFSLAKDLWPAEVDGRQIEQVIRNVVLNAREAMPDGGVVAIGAENVVLNDHEHLSLPRGDYVRVSITDQGVGIAGGVLPKIFDPYFSTKQRGHQKGMGLGLTICHSVVQKHEGTIAVESKEGVGTTFHIYLPAARNISPKVPRPASASVVRPMKVLVMDDDEMVREIVAVTLQQMGHEVELAPDGQMAVDIFGKAKGLGRPFDAVILDLTVSGGMGGRETIQTLRQLDPTVKAIIMSGYGNDHVVLEHDRYGFKGALTKPFDPVELQEILCRVMES